MIWLLRNLIGYITIEIRGNNCEQLLNCAAANNINLWNLHYKKGYIYGNISPKNFFKLYDLRHGLGTKIKIIKKHGIFFRLKRYKKRFGFIVGFFIFIAILLFLTNFIWIINIEGNNIIPTYQIINSCKKIGIYEGMYKGKLNNKYDAQRLQLLENGIAWCSLNTEGCILTVNLSEATISDKDQRQSPTNIKASTDGKIKKIDVTSGNVIVKVGDTVSKGDLLVSGIKENMSSTLFVHSTGEIIAETNRVFSAYGDFTQKKIGETGEKITRYSIYFFGCKIPLYLGQINKPYNYSKKIIYARLLNKKIPIKIACEEYKITQNKTVTYSFDELEEILYNEIQKQIKDFEFINIFEQTRDVVQTDKGILMKISCICEENIALEDEILLSKEN